MKQFFTTILAILYLASSSGAPITVHYCMGEEVSKGLGTEETCGKCGMKNKKGCCEDKVQLIKIQDTHFLHAYDFVFAPFPAVLQTSFTDICPAVVFVKTTGTIQNNSPPGFSGVSLFIRNCVFRL